MDTTFFDAKGRWAYVETVYYYRVKTDTMNYFRSFYTSTKNKYFEGTILNVNDTIDVNNKYSGACIWYHLNGNIKTRSNYSDQGVLNGIKEEFNSEGRLIKKTIYVNGKISDKKHVEFDGMGNTIDVFEEDFANNLMNWKLESSESLSSKVKIGGLEIINKTTRDYFEFSPNNIDSSNFSIETRISSFNLTQECKSGIVFGYKDQENYSYFYISKNKLHIGFVKDKIVTKKIENYFSLFLRVNDLNHLKILCLNDSVYFYINNYLQCYCDKGSLFSGKVGFNVSNGYYFFDNLIVKQFVSKPSEIIIGSNQLFYTVELYKFPVKEINSGVIIGKGGFILTSIKNVNELNKFYIGMNIHDTIKQYEAEVYLNNDFYHFTVLKIKDTSVVVPKSAYNFYTYSTIMEKKFTGYYWDKDSLNIYKRNKLSSDFKSIDEHHHFTYVGIKNLHFCEGSPMFDLKGNILGIITNVDKESKVNTVSMKRVLDILFTHPESNEVKHKEEYDFSNFENEIYTNIVEIKTF